MALSRRTTQILRQFWGDVRHKLIEVVIVGAIVCVIMWIFATKLQRQMAEQNQQLQEKIKAAGKKKN